MKEGSWTHWLSNHKVDYLNCWGPYRSVFNSLYRYYTERYDRYILIASGTGGAYILDALARFKSSRAINIPFDIYFTTRHTELVEWLVT